MFWLFGEHAAEDRDQADGDRRVAGDLDLLVLGGLAPLEDLLAEVVGEGCRGGDRQAGDDREDGREGDAGDDAEHPGPAQLVGEQRRRRVGLAGCCRDLVRADQRARAEADDEGEQVEATDEPDGPLDRLAGLLARGHGVKRWSTWGRPAVPSTSARASEMKSIFEVVVTPYFTP